MSKGSYDTVPNTGADSYQAIDPFGWTQGFGGNMMDKAKGALNAWEGGPSDPGSFMNKFLNNMGGLQGQVTDATSPLTAQLQGQVNNFTNQALGNVNQNFAGMNSLYSSGMGEAAGREAGQIASNAGVNLAQQQLGLLNSLGNNTMNQQGTAANQLQSQAAQFASPNYVSPEVAYTPGGFENFMNLLSGAGSLASGIGSFVN